MPRSSFLAALLGVLPACGAPGGDSPFDSPALVSISTGVLPTARTGEEYGALVAATGPNPPLAWIVVGGALPAGLALDGSSGALSGWPRMPGLHRFTVEVRDGLDPRVARDVTVAAARRTFDLDVARGPVALLPFPAPWLEFASPYEHAFQATGGTPPYSYEVAGGSGVAGVSLLPDGRLFGVPRDAPGDHDLVVRATDALGASAERRFDLRLYVLPLVIETPALADAAAGFPYLRTLIAHPDGGGPPITWSLAADSPPLPPGLALSSGSGDLVGTPTVAGTYALRVAATDAAGQTASKTLTLRVNPGPALVAVDPPRPRAGGQPVALLGHGFQPGMAVRFGIAPPVPAAVEDETRATVVPASAPPQSGPVAVTVTNPDGGAHAVAKAFSYPLLHVEFVREGVRGTARGSSRGLAAGDLDGDGLAEVFHVGSSGMEVIRPGSPPYAGAWTTKVVRSDGSFNDVRLCDVDRDGDLDAVASRSSTAESIETYLNDGGGGFPSTASRVTEYAKPTSFHNPHSIAVGDVDGDGVPDVAFTSCRGNQSLVVVMRGTGDGSFVEVHRADGTVHDGGAGLWAANAIALGDLDGDGRDDLVVTDSFPAACVPPSSCPSTPATNLHPGAVEVCAWRALSGPGGVPGPWQGVRLATGDAWLDGANEGAALYDHDGDGRLDLGVFGGYQDVRGRGLAFLAGDGAGGFSERLAVVTSYDRRFGARLDANLDGLDDLVVVGGDGTSASGYGTDLSVAECWLGGGPLPLRAWTSGPEATPGGSIPGSNPGRVVVADFDGDGLDDFAVDQSFNAKERYGNDQGDGAVEGVCVFLNRSR